MMADFEQQLGRLAGNAPHAFQRSTAERCEIEWAILNFSVISETRGPTLNSYEFRSSSYSFTSGSVWRLKVKPRVIVNGVEFVGLYVERCASSSRLYPVVEADVHLGILRGDGEICSKQRFTGNFASSDTKGIDEFIKRAALFDEKLNLLPNDILTVHCELDVYNTQCRQFFREMSLKAPPGLRELSNDMKNFLQSSRKTDIKLNIAGGSFECHKAVLSSRSPVFTTMIEDAVRRNEDFIKIDDISPVIVDLLLAYIYTGDLSFLLMEGYHLRDLFQVAETYQIADLESFLVPEIYKTKTVVPADKYEFEWKIANFSKFQRGGKFEFDGPTSKWFALGHVDWYVTMSCANLPDSRDTFIKVDLHRKSLQLQTHQARFEVLVNDVRGNSVLGDFVEHIFQTDDNCGVNITTRQIFDDSQRYLLKDALTLVCKVFVSCGDAENMIEQSELSIVCDLDESSEDSDFRNLSDDFRNLFLEQKFHDLKISSQLFEFNVHECIIAARASVPIQTLKEKLVELPSLTVKSFLEFLYTGDENLLDGHALKIYSLANDFHLDELRQKYSTRLGWILSNNNVFSVIKEAHKANDSDLKSKAMDFMSQSGEDLIRTQMSEDFQNENQELAEEILLYLASKVE